MLKFMFISALYLTVIFLIAFLALKLSYTNSKKQKKIYPDYALLTVKNQEDTIEGMVRCLAQKILSAKNTFTELIVLDLGSTDDTPSIVNILSEKYPFIHLMNKDEYITYIENLN